MGSLHHYQRGISRAGQTLRVFKFRNLHPPEWVTTRIYFQIWEFEKDHGISAKIHKSLSDAAEEADKELKAEIESGGSSEEIEKLHLKVYETCGALADLVNKHLR